MKCAHREYKAIYSTYIYLNKGAGYVIGLILFSCIFFALESEQYNTRYGLGYTRKEAILVVLILGSTFGYFL